MRSAIVGVIITGVVLAAVVRDPRVAVADSTYTSWQSALAGCVPLDTTLESEWNYVSTGGVGYQGTVTGGIDFVCPVQTHNDSGVDGFCFNYRDENGTATDSNISAYLRKVSRSTGAMTTPAEVESDDHSETTRNEECASFGGGLDMAANYYFVSVNATRTDGNDDAEGFMVAIVDLP